MSQSWCGSKTRRHPTEIAGTLQRLVAEAPQLLLAYQQEPVAGHGGRGVIGVPQVVDREELELITAGQYVAFACAREVEPLVAVGDGAGPGAADVWQSLGEDQFPVRQFPALQYVGRMQAIDALAHDDRRPDRFRHSADRPFQVRLGHVARTAHVDDGSRAPAATV